MIKLVEVKKIQEYNVMERKAAAHFELQEIWINPASIQQVKPDSSMKHNLSKGYLPEGLSLQQQFSKVLYGTGNNISVATVVGKPETVVEKIYKSSSKEILKG
tara:strand:+ start:299 stop:607 length:309 start_codon:yes stop_codon:yes gene_type:complete